VIEQAVALCTSGVVPASLIQQALKEEPAQLASLEEDAGPSNANIGSDPAHYRRQRDGRQNSRRQSHRVYKLLERHSSSQDVQARKG